MKLTNLTVVIRSAGERTADLCKALILRQVVEDAVFEVANVTPFNQASLASVQLALSHPRTFTALIDADVLIASGSLARLTHLLETANEIVFLVNTLTLDKFHLAGREGGIHLYRTVHLQQYLNFADDLSDKPRPEARFHYLMQKSGYVILEDHQLSSVHEFGQWRKDVLRKVSYRLHKLNIPQLKHARYLSTIGWLDADFKLAGSLRNVPNADQKATNNADEQVMLPAGISEKSAITSSLTYAFWLNRPMMYAYIYLHIPFKKLVR